MRILVRFPGKGRTVPVAWLKRLASLVLVLVKGREFEKKSELSIVLTGDSEIRKLNRVYRKKDRTTDVLAFSLLEGKRLKTGNKAVLPLGDVVISVSQAKRQAAERGMAFRQELSLLLAHGILHLLGYDHATPRQKSGMFRFQDRILKKFKR